MTTTEIFEATPEEAIGLLSEFAAEDDPSRTFTMGVGFLVDLGNALIRYGAESGAEQAAEQMRGQVDRTLEWGEQMRARVVHLERLLAQVKVTKVLRDDQGLMSGSLTGPVGLLGTGTGGD